MTHQNSIVTALIGAAIGACVGAVVMAAVSTVAQSSLYTATSTRPIASVASLRTAPVAFQQRQAAITRYAAEESASPVYVEQTQASGLAVPSTWVILASVAAAVNGYVLWSNRKVAIASSTGRREALFSGVAAASMIAGPAFAAYGDKANVFGRAKDVEQIFTIQGDGWTGIMPGKYNSSKEREVPGMVGRWEDNFDAVNASFVVVRSGPNDTKALGDLDAVRNSVVTPLLGQQAFDGNSISEGGFAPGRFSAASLLDQREVVKDGKTYYYYELLTRTADGNEGGRHQLYAVCASNGKLYIFKQQAGDKRWFKGLEKPLKASIEAFRVTA